MGVDAVFVVKFDMQLPPLNRVNLSTYLLNRLVLSM